MWEYEYAIGLDLSETDMRKHQVLPKRTHPINSDSGASGYILKGTKLTSSFGEGELIEYSDRFVKVIGNKKRKLAQEN